MSHDKGKKSIWSRLVEVTGYSSAKEYVKTLPILAKWLVVSGLVGLVVGMVGAAFGHTLHFVNGFRTEHPWIVLALPFGGLVIVAMNYMAKYMDDSGTNTIMGSIREASDVPVKMAPIIFISTAITHLCGGSAGRESAAIQLGGSLSNTIGKLLRISKEGRKIVVMCGMSAGFAALFGTPMAAAVFAMEVASVGMMRYSGFVPCVCAAFIGRGVTALAGLHAESFSVGEIPPVEAFALLKMLGFGCLVAMVSIVFCFVLHEAEYLYEKYLRNAFSRIALGGCLVLLLSVALRTREYFGSGIDMIGAVFAGGSVAWYAFLVKMLFTGLTLGAGFKGGEIVPAFCIGATFGCVVAGWFGLPATLVAACGMVGVFCGVTNSPLAALLLAFEMFGFAGMPYYLVTVAITYMLSGYGGLYREQRIMYSKMEDL